MHALLQVIESLVVALAIAAFAHFGVTVKDAPEKAREAVVQKVPAAMAEAPALPGHKPCPFSQRAQTV